MIDICAETPGTLMKYFYAEALKTIQMRMRQISDIGLNLKQSAVINIVNALKAATRAMKGASA